MSKKLLDPKIYDRLIKAESDLEEGRISRRSFNKILTLAAASAGVTFAELSPVHAWVATRMRKRKTTGAGLSIAGSCRFETARATYFSRTPGVAGNRTKNTLSFWMKIGALKADVNPIFNGYSGNSDTNELDIYLQAGEKLCVSGYGTNFRITTQVFRDPSAWSHVVIAIDTAQAAANDRIIIYVNGSRVSSFDTLNNPAQSASLGLAQASLHLVGKTSGGFGVTRYFDGSLSEIYFVDGQALTASSFGQLNATTGQWEAKQYVGSFGTTGFYLPFKSNSAVNGSGTASGSYPSVTGVTGLGADYSGNNNHWTGSGTAVTDQLIDTPANNFCVASIFDKGSSTSITNGALQQTASGVLANFVRGTMGLTSGKWYYEVLVQTNSNGNIHLGAATDTASVNTFLGNEAASWGWNYGSANSYKVNGNSYTSYGSNPASLGVGTVFGVAIDADAGKIWVATANTWEGSGNPATGANPMFSNLTTPIFPATGHYSGGSQSTQFQFNFGQGGQSGLTYNAASGGSFKYAPPSGFKALSVANLPMPSILKPSQYFAAATYVGNGSQQRVGAVIPSGSSYLVSRSLRFNPSNSAYLGRTPAASGNLTTWTMSLWFKRSGSFGTYRTLFSQITSAGATTEIDFETSDRLAFYANSSGAGFVSNAVFRDTTSWHHLVITWDTNNATASDRLRAYIDGSRITSFASSTNPSLGMQSYFNRNLASGIGAYVYPGTGIAQYFDGYIAEVNFTDGFALDATSFGQTDSTSGEWVPKSYTGSYGTNGFYLNFADNSNTTAATLGKDLSPNSNHWTPNAFSVAAGAAGDSFTDSPTQNYYSIDPNLPAHSSTSMSAGNTRVTQSTFGWYGRQFSNTSFKEYKNKLYWEFLYEGAATAGAGAPTFIIGMDVRGFPLNSPGGTGTFSTYLNWNGSAYSTGGVSAFSGAGSIATNTVVRFALDTTTGKFWIGTNSTWYGLGGTADPATGAYPTATLNLDLDYVFFGQFNGDTSAAVGTFNFGAKPFSSTAPAGFTTMKSSVLPAANATDFTPDLVIIKSRAGADPALYDSVRGATVELATDLTNGETSQPNGLQSFTKTGFKVGNLAKLNTAATSYVAWSWKKGTTPGLDIVTYTGTGSSNIQSHGLGVAPAMMMVKRRDSTSGWYVWHKGYATPSQSYQQLESIAAVATDASIWAGFAPGAGTFSVNNSSLTNATSATYVNYLWAEIPGFSRFGTYTGNGSVDGTFVWCGFKPAFILVKCQQGSTSYFSVFDAARGPWNLNAEMINLSDNGAGNSASGNSVDFLANGFKFRNFGGTNYGTSYTYIFMAIAETPFKSANAR